MRLWIVVLFALLITGCTANSSIPNSNQAFQLIDIQGEPYFLDNRSGVIYKIKKHTDGRFDINEPVGVVGHDRNSI